MAGRFAGCAAAALALAGCADGVDAMDGAGVGGMDVDVVGAGFGGQSDGGASPSDDASGERYVVDEPTMVYTLDDGTAIAFYLYDDGSVGMQGLAGGVASVLPSLLEAAGDSPAEVFWGITEAGTPVPEQLLAVQDELASTGDRPRWDQVVDDPQGWMRSGLALPRTYAPCVNSTFTASHCLPYPPYNHGVCKTDTNTGWWWETATIRRYHASLCVDAGAVDDTLTYAEVDAATCISDRVLHVVWGWFGASSYAANSYLTWSWIAPSGALSRSFYHSSWNASGSDNYDWSFMQVIPGACP